ncbi:hypothetical protein ACAX43_27165 [Paraburkholderia sp. IW21]
MRVETEKKRAGVIVSAEPARREQRGLTARLVLDFAGLPERGSPGVGEA